MIWLMDQITKPNQTLNVGFSVKGLGGKCLSEAPWGGKAIL